MAGALSVNKLRRWWSQLYGLNFILQLISGSVLDEAKDASILSEHLLMDFFIR